MKTRTILRILVSFTIPLAAGYIAGIATQSNIDSWYATLNKPFFTPPNQLFAPVWITLYILMGLSLFLVLQSPKGKCKKLSVVAFMVQLALNFAWSIIFFSYHLIGLSLVTIIMLWFAILWMIVDFRPTNMLASYLQIPYLLWVSFAMVLNAAIYYLNNT